MELLKVSLFGPPGRQEYLLSALKRFARWHANGGGLDPVREEFSVVRIEV
jgi:hypothetical protein